MQKYQLLLLTCCILNLANAQGLYENFRFTESIPCPFDSTAQVIWPEGWSVYHTQNNKWEGEIDSAWCISVELEVLGFNRRMYLNAEEIDGERPVFFQYRDYQTNPMHLPADMLYNLGTGVELYNDVTLIVGNTSPPLSGTLLAVDIPAEDFNHRDTRLRYYEFQDTIGFVSSSTCLASEKFSDQFVTDIKMAFTIHHTQTKGRLLRLYYLSFQPIYYFDVLALHEIEPVWWVDTSYLIPLWALATDTYYESYLLPYTSSAYPSSAHISYYDLSPIAEVDTAQTITVVVEDYMTLTPQLFTAFRGGLVSVTDTLRHRVEVFNNGGNMCIQDIEFTFGDDTKYIHRAGTIDMRGDGSCMMFKAGAVFEVAEKAKLEYGRNGMGFLAMKQGSQMILRDRAEITINNTLVLQLSPTTNHTQPTVFLYPGSTLRFSPEGELEAWGSADLRLRVVMLGGVLDASALSATERALIEIKYPEKADDQLWGNLVLIKDVTQDALRIYVHVDQEMTGTVSITDLSGHTVFERSADFYPGYFYYTLDLGDLPIGWFVASVRTGDSYLSAPFTHIYE